MRHSYILNHRSLLVDSAAFQMPVALDCETNKSRPIHYEHILVEKMK